MLFSRKKPYVFHVYEVTYLRPNGYLKRELRSDLPRVCEFSEFEKHKVTDYIGCSTGLSWKIKTIRIVQCSYLGL